MATLHKVIDGARSRYIEARDNLLLFTQLTRPSYRANWHHVELARRLDRVARGECKRLLVLMPPQHGKSELVSRRFPAYMLGRNPDLRLITCSHTHDLAVRMNRDVQRIMTSTAYEEIFRKFRLARRWDPAHGNVRARRKRDEFEIPGHAGSLLSAGVGNSISGLPADGAIIDDPFGKHEDANSSVIRQKIWDWYANDLHTRLSKDAFLVVMHTRWHRDDMMGRLLRQMADPRAEQWEILRLAAVREERPADPCDPRAVGEALWPDFKSAADLEIIRRQDLRAYSALYQQNPSDGCGAEWPDEMFSDWIWVKPEQWPKEFEHSIVCVDASKGHNDKTGDYCAIVFMGLKNHLLYVDAIMERIPLDQIIRKVISYCNEKKPNSVGIEADQFQELLIHEFRRQVQQQPKIRWPLYPMTTHGIPKLARIRQLTQYILNREFRFKWDSPGCHLLVDQLRDFPFAEHDDGPDALEMCTRLPLELDQ